MRFPPPPRSSPHPPLYQPVVSLRTSETRSSDRPIAPLDQRSFILHGAAAENAIAIGIYIRYKEGKC